MQIFPLSFFPNILLSFKVKARPSPLSPSLPFFSSPLPHFFLMFFFFFVPKTFFVVPWVSFFFLRRGSERVVSVKSSKQENPKLECFKLILFVVRFHLFGSKAFLVQTKTRTLLQTPLSLQMQLK